VNNNQAKISENNFQKQLVSTNYQIKPYKLPVKLPLKLKIVSTIFTVLQYLSPTVGGLWATRLWLATTRFPEPGREKRWSESARQRFVAHRFGPIAVYQWPARDAQSRVLPDAPKVLLIHGWNGRGLQLANFVKPLLKQGFEVICFDAPGHGRSPGHDSNLLRIANVVHTIADLMGPIDSIIGHSFGAMVMARVINDGLTIRKAVAISAPLNADYLINAFCATLKISGNNKLNLLQRLKSRFGDDVFKRISTDNNVKALSISGLIVHDSNDRDIPVNHAQMLNKIWQGSTLVITKKLGHQRILRNTSVMNTVVKYIVNEK